MHTNTYGCCVGKCLGWFGLKGLAFCVAALPRFTFSHRFEWISWMVLNFNRNVDFSIPRSGVGNLLLVTGQMSSVQLFGGPEFSLIL